MNNQRLILFILFTFSVFFLADAWQKEKQPPVASVPAESGKPAAGPAATPIPSPTQPLTAIPPATPSPASGVLQKGETVKAETDVFAAEHDTAGGDLLQAELLTDSDSLVKTRKLVLL